MNKLALVFPGIGYHNDKPLLYYGKKLAACFGYRIIEIRYGGFPYGVKGNSQLMRQVYESALEQTEEMLKDEIITGEDQLLILSKSVGTAVAAAWQNKHHFHAENIYFTPVEETFQFVSPGSGIVFHGTADSWAETAAIKELCDEYRLPLFITENADHSMETGDVIDDLSIIKGIMEECRSYLDRLSSEI
ncbi:MAG: alpha/beta hydrolase [Eubacterium sp.]|nr:alpha/beta hydrolase [Eubacterium sp.]